MLNNIDPEPYSAVFRAACCFVILFAGLPLGGCSDRMTGLELKGRLDGKSMTVNGRESKVRTPEDGSDSDIADQ